MAGYTELLNLYFKNPMTDGADNFNIETMLNENWRKIDKALGPLLPLSILPAKSVTYETGAATLATEESAPINFVLELAVEPVTEPGAITLVAFHAPNWPSATNGLILRHPSAATGEMVDEAYTFTDSGGNAINVDSFANGSLLSVALYPLLKKAYLVNPSITGRAKTRFEGLENSVSTVEEDVLSLMETVSGLKRVYTGSRRGTGTSSISLTFDRTPSIIMYFTDVGGNGAGFFVLMKNPSVVKFHYESDGYMKESNMGPDVTWGKTVKINFSTLNEFSASRFNSTLGKYGYVAFT